MRITAVAMAVALAALAATAAEYLAGVSLAIAPAGQVAGEKALVLIPRAAFGLHHDWCMVLAEASGRLVKEEGENWPHEASLDTKLGFYFNGLGFGPMKLFTGPFIRPTLSFSSVGGTYASVAMNFTVGLRLFQLYFDLPYSFAALALDLHPDLGLIPAFLLGVRW